MPAIDKIRAEMEQNAGNGYIQVVGGFLIHHLESNHGAEARIMADGKTIKGSLDEMQKEASKKRVGNCAVLTDREGFAIVLRYYGIDATSVAVEDPLPAANRPAPAKRGIEFDVSLDDFLGAPAPRR